MRGPAMADEANYRIDIGFTVEETTPVFVISVAAQLAGMHPQTLRQYDRLGLVSPGRTAGRGRRYSPRGVARRREGQRLSKAGGVTRGGIKGVLEPGAENDERRDELAGLRGGVEDWGPRLSSARRVFAAGPAGDIVAV